jgi:hypothetical protein
MRPTALATGIGAGSSAIGVSGGVRLTVCLLTGLVLGASAFVLSQTLANRLRTSSMPESLLVIFYLATFFGLAAASFLGCYLGAWIYRAA